MSLLSSSGTLAPKPFVIGALAVYLASFFSQMLLDAPVTMMAGLWPFTLVQIALIWAWYALHARRLKDAGRTSGMAIGVAAIYTLMIVLLILVMAVLTAGETSSENLKAGQGMIQLFAVLFFFSMLFGEFSSFGVVGYWVLGFIILMLTPVFVALVFSLWTATRPSALPKP
jgi:uncharacterized membrane protein YhaH (DUF805 family)